MKKTNPNRVPCSKGDIIRAEERGKREGAENMLTMVLWCMQEKMGASWDDLETLRKAIHELADHMLAGRITRKDIESALKEEHDCEVIVNG